MKKKAFLFLLLIPFIIAILAFVTATYVIRASEVDISGISWSYEENTPFMLKDGRQKLEATPIYDAKYPLSENNNLVWKSSDESVATIEMEESEAYIVPKKEGQTVISVTNAKGTLPERKFTAIIVGDGGAIIVNPLIPFSQTSISGVRYIGLYDTKNAYDTKGNSYSNSDAKLEFKVELIGSQIGMDSITIETSENVSYDRSNQRLSFNNVGEAYINFINPFSSSGSAYVSFTLVDAVNAYDYEDLLSLTNRATKPYKIVLRRNLESFTNTYNFDENSNILNKKSADTELFGKLNDENKLDKFDQDIYTFETTYNHDFLNKWNEEVTSGVHEGEVTNIYVKAGIHLTDDFYGNGFTINAHELTYPSGSQTITVNGETLVVPYLENDDLYRGPLPFVTLGNPNYSMSETLPMFTLYGQDNSAFYIDNDNVDLIDVHFKNCDFGNNLSNLEYVGTTLDINADNVTIKDSILGNGRNVIRSYSSKNLTIDNSLIQNSMEFLFRSGSNEFNHVDYSEKVNYEGENGRKLTSNKDVYLAPLNIGDTSSFLEKSYKADSMLTFSAILNTQAGEFLGITGPNYTIEEYTRFKDILIEALTNQNGMVNTDGTKNYAGNTTINNVYFSNSGISAISLDSLPQGSYLENNTTSIFGMLLAQYMNGASVRNSALTGYPTRVEVMGDTRFYDWKNKDMFTYESLVGQDIRSLIVAHGGLGSGFNVEITEDDYLPIKKILLDNYSNELISEEKLNLPVYYQGGGFNNSDIVFSSELSQKMTNTYEIDPFTYSLSLKAVHSDHFMTDPYAKYETMKVAMLRASSNVLGFNNHKIIGIKASDSSWLNQYPNLSDLINR